MYQRQVCRLGLRSLTNLEGNDGAAVGDKLRLALLDDTIDVRLPRFSPVGRICAQCSYDLGGGPVRDTSSRRLGIDLWHPRS